MPDDVLSKEQKELDDVFNDIMEKSDEELADEAAKAKAKETAEESGDSTQEQATDEEAKKAAEADLIKSVTGQEPGSEDPKPATAGIDGKDLQSRVDELEAELKKEHQRTSSWDGRIKAANSRVKELEVENQSLKDQLAAKANSTPSEDGSSDQEIMDTFKKTFPEFVEVLDIYQKKMDNLASKIPAKADPEPESASTEPEATDAKPVDNTHMTTIRSKHPDLDEMVGTGVLLTWINQQPDYVRDHLHNVYENGNSTQVINLCNAFKEKSGWKSQLATGDSTKEDKLKSMMEAEGESPGPKTDGPDKNDFKAAAKEAFA